VYGEKEKGMKRLALHAALLTLSHPVTKESMTFETKMPDYFKLLLND
jgi:tRNA pseudouridine32 synthase/23S rRNA pseudouridine746 synthase/23S rRNA pseudouridine1911/1915/1917 synthase